MSATAETTQTPSEAPKLRPLKHIHHLAFRCRDAEQTRWFYEDVLGLPLSLALDFDEEPGTGRKVDYMHLFFQMEDTNFIAFFDSPDDAEEKMFLPKHSFDMHVAFEVDTLEELKAWRRHINKMGRPCFGPIPHDFIQSIYMYDPNGIQVEITVKDANYNSILEKDKSNVHEVMKAWTEKTRERKEKKFGDALYLRGADTSKADFSKLKKPE